MGLCVTRQTTLHVTFVIVLVLEVVSIVLFAALLSPISRLSAAGRVGVSGECMGVPCSIHYLQGGSIDCIKDHQSHGSRVVG
jgi:hypothetical protein